MTKNQAHRLRGLFEGNVLALGIKLDMTPDPTSVEDIYVDIDTNKIFCLWLAGRQQGVVDHAHERGDISL